MRRFFSYGPIDNEEHYYAPRNELIEQAYGQLVGDSPQKGGHFITVWSPRQCGKTWVMQQVLERVEASTSLQTSVDVDVVTIVVDYLEGDTDLDNVTSSIAKDILRELGIKEPNFDISKKFQRLFTRDVLKKPLILILDEFDALSEQAINRLTRIFRNIYIARQNEIKKTQNQRQYLLHGLALVGVRSVLGIENKRGSPFNVQRSLRIPNLTYDEVKSMFEWYEKESGQKVEEEVIKRLFYETQGQPGLTCWFGELLTEGFESYTVDKTRPISIQVFDRIYQAAVSKLPNNNILNIISKANQDDYKPMVLKLFKTDRLFPFKFDDREINFLYMHGVIDSEISSEGEWVVKFSSPFVQKRLFNFFSNEMFKYMDNVIEPFDNLEDVITANGLNIKNILRRYQNYLVKNREWLFKGVPRRKDLRVFEAVFHFNLYMYLYEFLYSQEGRVYPEFPTGNGKVDLLIEYNNQVYAIEVKSFRDKTSFEKALGKAALYGKQLGLKEICIVFFIERIDDGHRKEYEVDTPDKETGIKVVTVFIETGNP
jgi:hypothetical protein